MINTHAYLGIRQFFGIPQHAAPNTHTLQIISDETMLLLAALTLGYFKTSGDGLSKGIHMRSKEYDIM